LDFRQLKLFNSSKSKVRPGDFGQNKNNSENTDFAICYVWGLLDPRGEILFFSNGPTIENNPRNYLLTFENLSICE